ncbi:MAG TPA: hypothetical protein VE944_30635 [Nostoc sp.]|nr:hypothetical protein [Nostoc sp.]HYX18648.1 hypothetical protein [Nostoc sp.]
MRLIASVQELEAETRLIASVQELRVIIPNYSLLIPNSNFSELFVNKVL